MGQLNGCMAMNCIKVLLFVLLELAIVVRNVIVTFIFFYFGYATKFKKNKYLYCIRGKENDLPTWFV
jgi:hypothetical protein